MKHFLSNGIPVLAIPSRQAPVVAIQGWIRFGAADESNDIAGIAHLFEHLLFKGTKKRAAGQIAMEVEGMGGDLNAYTSYDQTVMHLTLRSPYLEQGLDILADALIDSQVSDEELANEKPVIIEEIKRYKDMPGSVASELLRAKLFEDHPYARPVIGYEEVIRDLSREKIMEIYKHYYNANNIFLVVCGDFDTPELLKLCEKYFAKIPKGSLPKGRAPVKAISSTASVFKHHPNPDAIMQLAWQTPDCAHADIAALDALALILGQGESSRLYKTIVLEKKLVRSIDAGCWSPKNTGCFAISMKTPQGSSSKFNAVCETIRAVIDEPIRDEELQKAKRNLLSTNVYSKETVDGLAQRYGYFEAMCGNWELDHQYLKQVEALTVSDLERVKETYLNWNRCVAGGIIPEKDPIPQFQAPQKPSKKLSSDKKQKDIEAFNYKGLRVILKSLDHLPMFSLRWVGIGGNSIASTIKKPGLASLWGRTITNGCVGSDGKRWSRDDIAEYVEASTASLSSFHGRHSYGFNLDGLTQDFDTLFSLLCSIQLRPHFVEQDVELEKKHILLDIKSSLNSPSHVTGRAFMEAMFPKHPYGLPGMGTPEVVKKLRCSDLSAMHAQLVKQPQVLCVVGNISRSMLEQALDKNLAQVKFAKFNVKPLKKAADIALKKGPVFKRQYLKKEQTHIMMGFPTCHMHNKDQLTFNALAAVLGGQGGRLFIELRDKKSLCYSVSPTHMEAREGGYFGFYIATSPDKEKTAIEAMETELSKLVEHGITQEEWDRAKPYYVGNHQIEQQRFSYQSVGMALDELYGEGYENYLNFEKLFEKITVKDINAVIKKYFTGKNAQRRVVSIVGPKS